MNWTSFLITLALAYMAYYGLNLLFDLLISRKPPKTDSTGDVLFFDEDIRPEIIVPAEVPDPQTDKATVTAVQDETPEVPQTSGTMDELRPQLSGPVRLDRSGRTPRTLQPGQGQSHRIYRRHILCVTRRSVCHCGWRLPCWQP